MALIKCPECGKEVSDKAEVCIHCGYPLAKMRGTNSDTKGPIEEDNINVEPDKDATKETGNYTGPADVTSENDQGMTYALKICDCGPSYNRSGLEMSYENNTLGLNPKQACKYLKKVKKGDADPIFNVNRDINVLNKVKEEMEAVGCTLEIISISDDEAQKYIVESDDNSFLGSLGNVTTKSVTSSVPRCPTCGSTNVSRIGAINRVASVSTWGLASKKIDKTYKCNDCKYMW